MSIDSRLTNSISTVVSEINNTCYLTSSGFKELSWGCRIFRRLFSWTGLVYSTTQVCAQKTFDQIREAMTPHLKEDVGALSERFELIKSLYEGEMDLSSLKRSAAKACTSFENFLIESLGFDPITLKPPEVEVESDDASVSDRPEDFSRRSSVSSAGSVRSVRRTETQRRLSADLEAGLGVLEVPPLVEDSPRAQERRSVPSPQLPRVPRRTSQSSPGGPATAAERPPAPQIDPLVRIFRLTFPLSDDTGDPTHGNWIREIIDTLANTTSWGLRKEKEKLDGIGNALKRGGMHPLRFLSFILADKKLRKDFCNFKSTWMSEQTKYKWFVNDLATELLEKQREASVEAFKLHCRGFAASIGVRPEEIRHYFESTDENRWQQMIAFLLDRL